MNRPPRLRILSAITAGLTLIAAQALHAQQQFQGVCSRVKIAIQQELTIERIGFEATLEVTNNDGADPLTDFSAQLTFKDSETGEDAADLFFVQPPTFENINKIDGTGVIQPTKKAIVRWFLIPKIATGGTNPQGKEYAIGCSLAGSMRGEPLPAETLLVIADTITVKPEPQLEITYFQPRDVTADDPFTAEVESPIPFTLGVMVHNAGYGTAKKLKINSQQPKITENKNGLLLVARLLGARVQDSPLNESSLLVDLGDIPPGKTRKGAWDMITTLSGEFIDFKASYTHADELGGRDTSVIKSLNAHFIAAEVMNDEPGRDRILDFLADTDRDPDMLPDALYETDGSILPVNHLIDAEVTGSVAAGNVTVQLNADREGWGYMRLDDPAQARYPIQQVVRSDGKVLHPRNVWTNIRYRKSDNLKLTYLNLFDRVENGRSYTYAITYQQALVDLTPPVTRLRFAGEFSESGGAFYTAGTTQLYFTSEDESPVSIVYRLNGGAYRPALPFTLGAPGTYVIDYYATDLANNVEVAKTATVIVPGAEAPLTVTLARNSMFPTNLLSTRPRTIPISANVPFSALTANGELKIYQGVRAWPRLAGMPPSPTSRTHASLSVSGQFVDYYKYSVNGGAWSAERAASEPITLSGLSGSVTISVLARSEVGSYPETAEALSASWIVNAAAPALEVAGVPPTPSHNALDVTLQPADATASLYRWTIANGYYRAEEPLSTPVVLPNMSEGTHTVKFIGKRSGIWQPEAEATQVSWTFDKAYGFEFDELPLVRTQAFPNVAGTTIQFEWDGKDDAGIPQLPGAYTALLTITDSLGNKNQAAAILIIEGLSARQIALADTADGPRRTRAAGKWTVWQESASGISTVHARDLTTNGPAIAISNDPDYNQENPATDGHFVVWQARRPNNTTDILWHDLKTGNHGSVTDTSNRSEVNPSVSWPWIVYQTQPADNPSAPWQIEAWNQETNIRFLVHPAPSSPGNQVNQANQYRPRVHAGRVVWEDHRNVGPGEVYFCDLETRARRRITNNTFGQNNPVIFGDLIAWQDNRHSQTEIYMFDLLKGVEQRVTDTPYNEINPELAGWWLLFQEDSLGALTENLRLLDIQTGSAVSLTRAESQFVSGSLGNGFAVWTENLADSTHRAVASLLPGLQPVSVRANALAVTPALVSSFSTAFELLADWGPQAGISSVTTYDSFSPLVSRTATFAGGNASGQDFPLVAGSFLWVEFNQPNMADLGAGGENTLALANGLNAFSHAGFPVDATAHRVIAQIGPDKIRGLRFYDAFAGRWRAVEVTDAGELIGPDFAIPRVATLLLDMKEPLPAWKP
jgi:beta propeller repeat protein